MKKLKRYETKGVFGTLHKALEIVFARETTPLTLIDRKVFNFLSRAAVFQEGHVMVASVKELMRFLGHTSTVKLNESLERLRTIDIIVEHKDEDGILQEDVMTYINCDLAQSIQGDIQFSFHPVMEKLVRSPKRYGTISLDEIRKFRSAYALKLYEAFGIYARRGQPTWKVSMSELRLFLNLPEDAYSRIDNFKARILTPAIAAINKTGFYNVYAEYKKGGRGNIVKSVRFHVSKKDKVNSVSMPLTASLEKDIGVYERDGKKFEATMKTDLEIDFPHKTCFNDPSSFFPSQQIVTTFGPKAGVPAIIPTGYKWPGLPKHYSEEWLTGRKTPKINGSKELDHRTIHRAQKMLDKFFPKCTYKVNVYVERWYQLMNGQLVSSPNCHFLSWMHFQVLERLGGKEMTLREIEGGGYDDDEVLFESWATYDKENFNRLEAEAQLAKLRADYKNGIQATVEVEPDEIDELYEATYGASAQQQVAAR